MVYPKKGESSPDANFGECRNFKRNMPTSGFLICSIVFRLQQIINAICRIQNPNPKCRYLFLCSTMDQIRQIRIWNFGSEPYSHEMDICCNTDMSKRRPYLHNLSVPIGRNVGPGQHHSYGLLDLHFSLPGTISETRGKKKKNSALRCTEEDYHEISEKINIKLTISDEPLYSYIFYFFILKLFNVRLYLK